MSLDASMAAAEPTFCSICQDRSKHITFAGLGASALCPNCRANIQTLVGEQHADGVPGRVKSVGEDLYATVGRLFGPDPQKGLGPSQRRLRLICAGAVVPSGTMPSELPGRPPLLMDVDRGLFERMGIPLAWTVPLQALSRFRALTADGYRTSPSTEAAAAQHKGPRSPHEEEIRWRANQRKQQDGQDETLAIEDVVKKDPEQGGDDRLLNYCSGGTGEKKKNLQKIIDSVWEPQPKDSEKTVLEASLANKDFGAAAHKARRRDCDHEARGEATMMITTMTMTMTMTTMMALMLSMVIKVMKMMVTVTMMVTMVMTMKMMKIAMATTATSDDDDDDDDDDEDDHVDDGYDYDHEHYDDKKIMKIVIATTTMIMMMMVMAILMMMMMMMMMMMVVVVVVVVVVLLLLH
ncbi:hypothetical protein AK812_SmicGene13622 [Symbiodinium microadriaticum]|uniref:Uncharacterized protein n=1 Tax=Symbiodinium microadriaticum TaxID=2951 RepID=A0A1Q9E7N7_SYMMI|nr:hypothetical protein AK812_SmicGene13622 [Symbiodinium microadriaticum]